MTTWLALWECLCSTVGTDPDALPDRCPGHLRERAADLVPEKTDRPMAVGHQCGVRDCAAAKANRTPHVETTETEETA